MAEIGTTLRDARMRARISIDEVETRTKIRAKYLRAIENEEWDLLPGAVYAKSFIRTYAEFLGLDSRLLVDEFRRRYERPSDHDLRPMPSLSRERERGRRGPRFPSWVVISLVLFGALALLFVIGVLSPKTKNPAPTGTRAGPAPRRPTHHHRPATPRTVRLQLRSTATVYVCLVDQTGRKLVNQQTLTPGQTIPTQTAPKLLLTLGNASVRMRVNGRLVPIAPSPSAIRLLIEPKATRRISLTAPPTCP